MTTHTALHQALDAAVLRLLRPLVRLLLRHAVPFPVFAALAKRAYVEVAMTEFAIPDKRPTLSRASILTGLTRKDVQRLVGTPQPAADADSPRLNRAIRVLGAWARDADFVDAQGAPRPLEQDGAVGFAALVRRHSGDMPARAVLDELLRVGAVRRRDDGRIEPLAHGYVPRHSAVDKLHMLGTDVADLIATIDHNLAQAAPGPRFQRKVMYRGLDPADLPALRALSAAQAQALLERLDDWLAERAAGPPGPPTPADAAAGPRATARAGLGIYYVEEISPSPPNEGAHP